MYSLLCRLFIKNYKNTSDSSVRLEYGAMASALSIALNVLLALLKVLTSFRTFSISVLTDAVNNMTDASSSIITLAGFKISKKRGDKEHPYGHGRAEYISLFFVAFFIMLSAFYAAKKSLLSILKPSPLHISPLSLVIIIFCILLKLYMSYFNYKAGNAISSPLLKAYASDCLADSLSSFSILAVFFASPYLAESFPLDAILSLILASLLFYNGFKIIKETVEILLGKGESRETVEEIKKVVMEDEAILGVHDVNVHDYGVKMKMVSLHAEVDSAMSLNEMHEIIDNAEKRVEKTFDCRVVIHADPVDTRDKELSSIKIFLKEAAYKIDRKLNIHDVRLHRENGEKLLTFDMANEENIIDEETVRRIKDAVHAYNALYKIEITVDSPLYSG